MASISSPIYMDIMAGELHFRLSDGRCPQMPQKCGADPIFVHSLNNGAEEGEELCVFLRRVARFKRFHRYPCRETSYCVFAAVNTGKGFRSRQVRPWRLATLRIISMVIWLWSTATLTVVKMGASSC